MKRRQRRGAVAVESAIILGGLSLLLLGMLELSLMLLNHTTMSEGARRVARAAMVRGDRSPTQVWGPTKLTLKANDNHAAAEALRSILCAVPAADVQLEIEWLDGDNSAGDRVRVTVQHTHKPIVPAWGWNSGLVLRGSSTMQIAH
ncbi:TadE/TadG family type IV pilus assembly protein [Anatilimnocola floriformis]|uniref:TadE/TadG family type IV pilus assembly protein n=1 Tax=Anatilimnocola floriformis TaxID=2948575 RepID=UPI0020C5215D|nr:TadE/TadG family type IV pilus assembly protein [Anatilimnocola floriformis]